MLIASLVTCATIKGRDNPLREPYGDVTLVTGLAWTDDSAHVPVRREIRDLMNNSPDQWNIYLLGLKSFFAMNQSLSTSFYQIAGIHGMPYQTWEGAEGLPGKPITGYCPHSNTLFFGWHRPYLALYEQELYRHIRAVALEFPPPLRNRYAEAADAFRIPYWDWALGSSGGNVPDIFTMPTVQVLDPRGNNLTITNPLHHYEFQKSRVTDFVQPWAVFNTTLRWPTSNNSEAISQDKFFSSTFVSLQRSFQDSVAKAFGTAKSLNEFSVRHIEGTHGGVHYIIGGDKDNFRKTYVGHMWPVEYSAFEPLFMLIHCNVDRLFALWQAAHPDLWMDQTNIGTTGNFVIDHHSWVDGDTPLKPFWKTQNSFWTTNDVRNTIDLGYAYPETQRWNFPTEKEYRTAVNASIAKLYSPSTRARLSTEATQGRALASLVKDNTYFDWSINVGAAKSSFTSSFIVELSLAGDFSSDVANVGMWSVLMPKSQHGDGVHNRRGSSLHFDFEGTVSLTPSLLDHVVAGKLESLDRADVIPFLKEALTWTIYSGNGQRVPRHLQDGLSVTVVSSTVHIPEDPTSLLEYSDLIVEHPEVTQGKIGGRQM